MKNDRSELRIKTGKEMSAGGVVYRKNGDGSASSAGQGVFILLIMPAPRESATREAFRPVWTFPKGWVGDHTDETMEQTALREVKEEGGVEAKIIESLGEVKYFFRWQGENIFKTVEFFLMEYVSGDPADHDHEVDEAKWVPLEQVEEILTYKEDKEIFAKAKKILEK